MANQCCHPEPAPRLPDDQCSAPPEVDLGQSSIRVDVVTHIQDVISLNLQAKRKLVVLGSSMTMGSTTTCTGPANKRRASLLTGPHTH